MLLWCIFSPPFQERREPGDTPGTLSPTALLMLHALRVWEDQYETGDELVKIWLRRDILDVLGIISEQFSTYISSQFAMPMVDFNLLGSFINPMGKFLPPPQPQGTRQGCPYHGWRGSQARSSMVGVPFTGTLGLGRRTLQSFVSFASKVRRRR